MKLIKTIDNLVKEAQEAFDKASEVGVSEKELDRLEKNLEQTRKLMKIYKNVAVTEPKSN